VHGFFAVRISLAFVVRLLFDVRRIPLCRALSFAVRFFSFFAVRSFVAVRVFVVGRQRFLCRARDARQCLAARQQPFFSSSEIKKCNHVSKKNLQMSGAMHYTSYFVAFLKKLYYVHQGMEGVM
jgi:hypothetical protein